MSKRRSYRNLPSTDAPQQKPGSPGQAHATQVHLEPEHLAHQQQTKRRDETGETRPTRVNDIEMP